MDHSSSSGMFKCLPNYKCPLCSKEMMIAGKKSQKEDRAEGKDVVQRYTCYGCGERVIPVKI